MNQSILTNLVDTPFPRNLEIASSNPLQNLADINAFAFSPLNLSNPLILRIVKYAKVTKVNH